MSKRIDKLTDEQRSHFEEHADKWIAYGLNTDSADFDQAVEGIKACYEFAGIPWHGNVVRVSSPIVMAFAGPIAGTILGELRGRNGAVSDAVSDAVRGAVSDAVHGAVRGAVDGAVHGAVSGAVSDAVHGAVSDAVRGIPSSRFRTDIKNNYYKYTGGYWSWWSARNTFFCDFTDLELNGNLWDRSRAFEQTIANAGWWWPHTDFVMVCDRPKEIHREQVGERGWGSHRLHNERGPSISWRDCWELYFIHGVRVTEQIVMFPETLTTEQIMKEENAEVRRIMCEKMGWEKFITEAGLTMIDECDDPANMPNKLRLYETPEQVLGVPVRLLSVVNATPKLNGEIPRYAITVPAEIDSALAGAAWSFDVPVATYATLARAT